MATTTSIGSSASSGAFRMSADGAGITPEILLAAYAAGVFPMAESADDPELFWVDPHRRGILPLDAFHLPHRLRRVLRQGRFEIRCDSAFEAIIRGCAKASRQTPQYLDQRRNRAALWRAVRRWFGAQRRMPPRRHAGGRACTASRSAPPFLAKACSAARPTRARWPWFIWSPGFGSAAIACSTSSS